MLPQTFVLQRPKRGGEGLVLSNQVSGMQVMEAVTPPASPLARALTYLSSYRLWTEVYVTKSNPVRSFAS